MNSPKNRKPKTAQQKNKTLAKKKAQNQAKNQTMKLTRAQYDDLRQIEWIPFDPYAD